MLQRLSAFKLFLGVFLALAATACQDPYPKSGQLLRELPEEPNVPPPLVLDLKQQVMEFEEGVESQFTFRAVVDQPGDPVVTVSDLPQGASFDPATLTLKWTPDFVAANDDKNPEVITRNYPIKVSLRSSVDPNTVITRMATLLVHDSAREITFNLSSDMEPKEGQNFDQTVAISAPDFPDSEMHLISQDLPLGTTITRLSAKSFRLSFRAPNNFVKNSDSNDTNGYFKKVDFSLTALGPRTRRATAKYQWRVRDQRLKPLVSTPEQVSDVSSLAFVVSAQDLNEETRPRAITLSSPNDLGQVTIRPINPSTSPFLTVLEVQLRDIPQDKIGSEGEFKFQFCSLFKVSQSEACAEKTIRVRVAGVAHRSPRVERQAWPVGTIEKMDRNQSKNFDISFRDGDTLRSLDNVTVSLSRSDLADVTWEQGTLRVETKNAFGLVQIDLIATSIYGLTATSSFMLEVLEPTRSAPAINRDEWQFGEVKQITVDGDLSLPLPITDADTGDAVTDVTVLTSRNDVANVTWNQGVLRVKALRKREDLQVRILARSAFGVESREEFLLRVVAPTTSPPLVDRQNWPRGEVQIMKTNRQQKFILPIVDGDSGQAITDVTVSMHRNDVAEISWENGELNVKTFGLKEYLQFEVTARSAYGLVTQVTMFLKVD